MRKMKMMPLLLCLAVIMAGCGNKSTEEVNSSATQQSTEEVNSIAAQQSTEEESNTMDFSQGMTCVLESQDAEKMNFTTIEGKTVVIDTALFNEKRSEGDHRTYEIGDHVALYYNTMTENPDGTYSIDLEHASYFEMDASKYIVR